MDKLTLSKYGWFIITFIVIFIIISGASLIGSRISRETTDRIENNIETYSVTLDPTDGEVLYNNLLVITGKQYGLLPTPTCDGKTFLGWYTSEGERITSQTVYTGTADHTLYAVWE